MTGRRAGTRGFTLIEIAVALAIVGMGAVTCLQLFSGSLRLQDRASRESRAVLAARAAMDALLFQPEIRDHTEERTSGEGYRIRMVVRHAGASEGLRKSELGFESELSLRYLQVDVAWEDGIGVKTYTLKSLRAAPEND